MADQPATKRHRVDGGAGVDDAVVRDWQSPAATVDDDAGDDGPRTHPSKEMLMPPVPGVPPLSSAERKEKGWRWASKHGMAPPEPVYGPKDTALWPEDAAELFRATKTNHDAKYASRYMRWWFKAHEDMPGRVPKIPRSAYSMYYTEQKSLIFRSAGKFNQKRDGKKIGAAWKVLSEDKKRSYEDKFATLQAEQDANEEWWNEKMSAWREERRERLRSEGVELDPVKRQSTGLQPLCECSKCGPVSTIVDLG